MKMNANVRSVPRSKGVAAVLLIAMALLAVVAAVNHPQWMSVAGSQASVSEVAGAMKTGLQPGNYAPDFTLSSVDGETVSLSQFRGERPVLLNLWSVTCAPCHQELDELKILYPEYKDRLEMLSVQIDPWFPPSFVAELVSDKGLPFTVLVDEKSAVATLYRATAVPANFFIDDRGVIRNAIIGSMGSARLKGELDQLLR